MSDIIVWYAPEILPIALLVTLIAAVTITARAARKRRRYDEPEFECVEVISD